MARGAKPSRRRDIFATVAGAARVALPADRKIDGVNLIPFLRDETGGAPHGARFWRSGHYESVLAGGWKLQVSERPKKVWLFDLDADPTERVDVSANLNVTIKASPQRRGGAEKCGKMDLETLKRRHHL